MCCRKCGTWHICFSFSSRFWISFREIQKLDGPKSEKLKSSWKGTSSFSLLGPSSFWISQKLIKNDEKLDDSAPDQLCLAISDVALSGQEAPKTLKLKGTIQGLQILIVVNSGSSHSFISEQVAHQLQGVTPSAQLSHVKVANGSIMQSLAELLKVS
jgi:hypothetical protein